MNLALGKRSQYQRPNLFEKIANRINIWRMSQMSGEQNGSGVLILPLKRPKEQNTRYQLGWAREIMAYGENTAARTIC